MDSREFDSLAKKIAEQTSRRGVLKAVAGGAAAGLLALFGVREASAEPVGGRGGRGCVADCKQRFGPGRERGRCIDGCGGAGAVRSCRGVTCQEGEVCCNGVCTFLEYDEANCGACGNACGTGEVCCFMQCAPAEGCFIG